MIETKLYQIIKDKVDAVDAELAAGNTVEPALMNLAGLFVHDHLFRPIDINTKPNGIRVARPEGNKGLGSDTIIEGDCAVPVLVYVLIGEMQDGGDARAAAFEYADAIANVLLLYLHAEGLATGCLNFEQMPVPFVRVDHSYDSNPYAVVSMTLSLGECPC